MGAHRPDDDTPMCYAKVHRIRLTDHIDTRLQVTANYVSSLISTEESSNSSLGNKKFFGLMI